jgi:signal transduction histidine kinase
MRPRLFTLLAAVAAAFATLVVTFVPWLRFAYRSVEAHAALETAAVLIAFVTAVLVMGRFHARRRADDLALVCALFGLSTANLVFATLPDVLGHGSPERFVWASIVARLGAAAMFFAAAVTPPHPVRAGRGPLLIPLATTLSLLAIAGAAGFFVLGDVGLGVTVPPSPEAAARPYLGGHPLLLGSELVGALAFAAAAVGFLRKAAANPLAGWLSTAAVFGAFARLNYFLFPSIYSDWFYAGDFFRLAFYGCLLIAAVQEIRAHWHGLARAAVLEERRRLARDLHDGVAQELAFIRSEARRAGGSGGAETIASVAAAADRALDESRRAIAALTRRADEPLYVAVAQVAEDVAARAGGRVALDLDATANAAPENREALLKIMSEAVTNALRHGEVDIVSVELRCEPLTLRIHDRGRGFDLSSPSRSGFGLTSMRERAARIGAQLSIRSRPGAGTQLEVILR